MRDAVRVICFKWRLRDLRAPVSSLPARCMTLNDLLSAAGAPLWAMAFCEHYQHMRGKLHRYTWHV